MGEVGWTKAEYDQCPELAGRLHSRILDLQDVLHVAREALSRIERDGKGQGDIYYGRIAFEALQVIDKALEGR